MTGAIYNLYSAGPNEYTLVGRAASNRQTVNNINIQGYNELYIVVILDGTAYGTENIYLNLIDPNYYVVESDGYRATTMDIRSSSASGATATFISLYVSTDFKTATMKSGGTYTEGDLRYNLYAR